MSFVHECNKNNRDDNRRDEFAWHNKILSNLLRFITLFVQINKMTISVGECLELKQLGESVNLCSMERVAGLQQRPTGHSFKKTFFFALFRNEKCFIANWCLINQLHNSVLPVSKGLTIIFLNENTFYQRFPKHCFH